MERLRIGLIGAGRIGQVHAESVHRRIVNADLAAIADVNETAAVALSKTHNVQTIYSHAEQLLDDSSIDAVIIACATDTHAAIIEDAARAGKHIFCEKPIATDLAAIDSAIAAVETAGVKLQVGFNRRFDANFERMRKAVASGEIGDPHLLHITSRDPAPPPLAYVRVSGGLFLDMTIHDFDMARFLMGCEVTEVYATGAVLVDEEIGAAGDIDTAIISLKFENGALGSIDNSRRAAYGYDQRAEIFGSDGSIRADNVLPNNTIVSNAQHICQERPLYFFLERYQASFVKEMQAFVDVVLDDGPVPVTGHDGKMPVVVAIAAKRSLDEHRPVKIAEIMS